MIAALNALVCILRFPSVKAGKSRLITEDFSLTFHHSRLCTVHRTNSRGVDRLRQRGERAQEHDSLTRRKTLDNRGKLTDTKSD